MKTKKIALMGLYISMALVLHVFERMLPIPFIAPGVKLGLTNIITLIALMTLSFKETFIIVVLRIILGSAFGGGVSALVYSISGGILSLFSMYFIKRIWRDRVSLIGISIIGAFFHNLGQLLAASIVVSNIGIFVYFPVLLISGLITGIFIGITSKYLLHFLQKHNKQIF